MLFGSPSLSLSNKIDMDLLPKVFYSVKLILNSDSLLNR